MFGFNRKKQPEQELIPVFMPSLVSLLPSRRKGKGSPLTETEVLEIRNKSTVCMVPADKVAPIAVERSYDDIDPENCWDEWQQIRPTLETSSISPK